VKLRRTWPQRLLITFNLLFIIGLVGTAASLGYVFTKYSRLPRYELGSVLADVPASSEPQNFLIVGVDSAEGLDPTNPIRAERKKAGVSGLRSDTVMILRIDPAAQRASLLSLPRDLWVPIAGTRGSQRINTAIQDGGPEALIQTVQNYFSVPINHYVQIDFAGFQDVVSAVDGVPVYFPTPVRDRKTGLDVKEPGCITLGGSQALAYARSRAYQLFEHGRWRTDPTGDLGRISRQQDFIRRALKRAAAKGIRNPVTLNRLVDVGLRSVIVDEKFSADDIASLGNRLRTFNPANLAMYALPVADDTVGGAAILRMVAKTAQPVLDIFRGVQTGDLKPSAVRIQVLNGTGKSGQATTVARDLASVGFGSAGTADADAFGHARTIVRYTAGNEGAADLVERYLTAGADLEKVTATLAGDVVVISGQDYAGVRQEPLPSTSSTSSTTGPGSSSTSSTTSTSTSIIGEVPSAPPPEVHCG
jgi:LCP family protein required for cell wall assembly